MKLGDTGSNVKALQSKLTYWGYNVNSEESYGILTKKAVIEIQKKLGISATGIWEDSIETLYRLYLNNGPVDRTVSISNPTTSAVISNRSISTKGRSSFVVDYIECYIINLNSMKKIVFGLETPEEVSDDISANFDDISVKGRSSPFKSFINTGPRTISFTISLSADYCSEGIVNVVDNLRALCYPYKSGTVKAPKCFFKLGTFMSVTAVPQSVGVTWKKPYKDGIYTLADVSISISEVEAATVFASEVER